MKTIIRFFSMLALVGGIAVTGALAQDPCSDLDTPTLYQYIDRFLMFYIRTADRLQRTSVWRDNLEGGLDYLKDVIIHDSLGIGAELEAEMALVIDTYQDEWKTAINDPATLKRFRTFVNDDAADSNVVFVQERGQIRPAREEEKAQFKGIALVSAPATAEEGA